MQRKTKSFLILLLPFFWAGVIFSNSLKPALQSEGMSNPLAKFLQDFLGAISIDITQDTASFIVRKTAHLTEFAIMAILIAICFLYYKYHFKMIIIPVLFFGLLTALTDETIQLFVEGRSGEVRDILVDFAGVIIGASIILIIKFIKKCKLKSTNS